MADELEKEFHADVTLIPGSGGVFDVTVDGKLVFSKSQTGRFPEQGEVVSKLKK